MYSLTFSAVLLLINYSKVEGASKFTRRSIFGLSIVAIAYSVYAIYASGEGSMIGGTIAIIIGYIVYQLAFNIVPTCSSFQT